MKNTTICLLLLAVIMESVSAASNSQYFELSSLRGLNGFTIHGISSSGFAGSSVSSAGDVNGDGIDDFLVGAYGESSSTGATYVIFGSSTIHTDVAKNGTLELSNLDGTNGFVINGVDTSDQSGFSVSSAGDFNQDGFDDILIGAWFANSFAGEAYIVYGNATIGSSGSLSLSTLDGRNGFVILGETSSDNVGFSVSGGYDFNNDGFDDVIIGAKGKNTFKGAVYMVLGGTSVDGGTGTINLADLDGSNGFIMNGVAAQDACGTSVRFAGDINGDSLPDVIIGASSAEPNSVTDAGEVYVIYGTASLDGGSGVFELSSLNGANGITLYGSVSAGAAGVSVSTAGDINNDNFDDILIGSTGGATGGSAYVVYGSASLPSTISLSNLTTTGRGVIITGITSGDQVGWTVSTAGDFNGDGFDDILLGAYGGDPNSISGAGETFMIFGGASLTSPISLSSLDGADGFIINGIATSDRSGYAVNVAGDVNSDGFMDYLIGADYADPNGVNRAGEAYLLLGNGGFTYEPTSFPTSQPTPYPTSLPTPKPTTSEPTAQPTSLPTILPIPSPTSLPTSVPIPLPTPQPTFNPTFQPTLLPFPLPSAAPIIAPTPSPTPQPTLLPSPVPTPQPTLQPTYTPTHVPTSLPTGRPTPAPSLLPTTEDTVSVSTAFTLKATTVSTASDQEAVKNLVANYSGVSVSAIKNFLLDDGTRRRLNEEDKSSPGLRKLVDYFWDVSCDIEADLNTVAATSAASFSATIRSQLNSGEFYLSVRGNIPTVTSVDSVSAAVNTRHPTAQPTMVPSSVPTQMPIKKKKSNNDDANAAMMYLLTLLVIPLAVIAFLCYRYKVKIQSMCFGTPPPEEKEAKDQGGLLMTSPSPYKHHHDMDDGDREWLASVPPEMLRSFMLQAAVHRAKSQRFEMSKEQVDELRQLSAAAGTDPSVFTAPPSLPFPPPAPIGSPLGSPLGVNHRPGSKHHKAAATEHGSKIAQRIAAAKAEKALQEQREAEQRQAAKLAKKKAEEEEAAEQERLLAEMAGGPGGSDYGDGESVEQVVEEGSMFMSKEEREEQERRDAEEYIKQAEQQANKHKTAKSGKDALNEHDEEEGEEQEGKIDKEEEERAAVGGFFSSLKERVIQETVTPKTIRRKQSWQEAAQDQIVELETAKVDYMSVINKDVVGGDKGKKGITSPSLKSPTNRKASSKKSFEEKLETPKARKQHSAKSL